MLMNDWQEILKTARGAAKRLNHTVFTQAVENITRDRETFKISQIKEEVIREYAALLVEGEHMSAGAYANRHAKARVSKEMIGQKINKLGYHRRNKTTGDYERIGE